jgi:hypothetical protein
MFALVLVGLMSLAQGASIDHEPVAIVAEATQSGDHDQARRPPASLSGPVRLSFGSPVGKNPFGYVFVPDRPGWERVPARPLQPGTDGKRPRVVCGLTIWEADPELDGNMPRVTPEPGIDFTIRRITPSICRD